MARIFCRSLYFISLYRFFLLNIPLPYSPNTHPTSSLFPFCLGPSLSLSFPLTAAILPSLSACLSLIPSHSAFLPLSVLSLSFSLSDFLPRYPFLHRPFLTAGRVHKEEPESTAGITEQGIGKYFSASSMNARRAQGTRKRQWRAPQRFITGGWHVCVCVEPGSTESTGGFQASSTTWM